MGKRPSTSVIKIPDVLVEAVKSKRVIPFLGAGASKEAKNAAGKQPPDANQLRDILAQKFFGKPMPHRDVMAVAEMAIAVSGGSGLVYEAVRQAFDGFQPSPAHNLVTSFNWRMIATTNYDCLIERAYNTCPKAVHPEQARQLYLDIATMHQFGVNIRAGTISRISGIELEDYQKDFFYPLENIVRVETDTYSGDYCYRTRHSRVATLVFRQVCSDDASKARQFIRLLEGFDVGYSSDRRALEEMTKGRGLAENFSKPESVRLTDVVRAGKARYIGFSGWAPEQIRTAMALPGVEGFISSQPQYSLLHRGPEAEVIPLSAANGVSQIVWSPLAQGVLSGKYIPGAKLPAQSRTPVKPWAR